METNLQEHHLLLDLEDSYVRAKGGKRFANYIIDIIAFYLVLVCIGIIWALISPDTLNAIVDSDNSVFADRILGLVLYVFFMFGQETLFKGRSIGKMLTGTRAVNLDGTPINSTKAMLRALSRAVPFCAFSALGSPCNPWQDRWTDTVVIDVRRSADLNL